MMMETMTTEERASHIVRDARLPRGKYGLGRSNGCVELYRTATDAVAIALATAKPQRLYRLADGWRFVGELKDGALIDQRRES